MFRFVVISPNATYSLSSNAVSAPEGTQFIVTVNTTGVQNGQALPYVISGTGIAPADFVGLSSLTGDVVIQNNTAALVLTTTTDALFETTETLTVSIDGKVSVDIDVTNVAPGTIFDAGVTVFDIGSAPSGATYWDVP